MPYFVAAPCDSRCVLALLQQRLRRCGRIVACLQPTGRRVQCLLLASTRFSIFIFILFRGETTAGAQRRLAMQTTPGSMDGQAHHDQQCNGVGRRGPAQRTQDSNARGARSNVPLARVVPFQKERAGGRQGVQFLFRRNEQGAGQGRARAGKAVLFLFLPRSATAQQDTDEQALRRLSRNGSIGGRPRLQPAGVLRAPPEEETPTAKIDAGWARPNACSLPVSLS